jgi:hypothetical protein
MTEGCRLITAARIAISAICPMCFAVLQALPRIARTSPEEGYLLESLMAAVAPGAPTPRVASRRSCKAGLRQPRRPRGPHTA